MSKRAHTTAAAVVVHEPRAEQLCGCLRWFVHGLRSQDGMFVVKCITTHQGDGGDIDSGQMDSADYIITFKPPIHRERAARVYVGAEYVGRARVERTVVFGRTLQPTRKDAAFEHLVYRSNDLEYMCYETHQLRIDDDQIYAMHVRIVNVTVRQDARFDLVLRADIDLGMRVMPELLQSSMQTLKWFPPDVDPAHWGLRIDPRAIPQRTPLWFSLRGAGGSKAYKLLGYFVPKDATSVDDGSSFSAVARLRMRRGTYSENEALFVYSLLYPARALDEVGWCPAPKGYPIGWGASPDMGVRDPSLTWDNVPESIAKHYDAEERAKYDITRGGLEIKTGNNTDMGDYYYPQNYMEMIALGAIWIDTLRFRPVRYWNAERRAWDIEDQACVYRVWRHPPTEEMLMTLWKRSLNNAHVLGRTVQEEPHVDARKHFRRLAAAATKEPTATFEAATHPQYVETVRRYTIAVEQLALAQPLPDGCGVDEAVEDELHERAHELMRATKRHATRAELLRMLAAQMNTLSKDFYSRARLVACFSRLL